MIVPIAVMVLSMPLFLYVTGEGDISVGSDPLRYCGLSCLLWQYCGLKSCIPGDRLEELMSSFLQGAGRSCLHDFPRAGAG